MRENAFSRTFKKGIRMRQCVNAPAKSSLFFMASNLISKGAALIFTPFFTRLLTPTQYGTYSLFLSYLSVLTVIGTLELGGSVIIRAFQKYQDMKYSLILLGAGLSTIVSIVATVAFYLIKLNTGGAELFPGAYVFLLVSLVCTAVINLFSARARFLYKPCLSFILTLLQSILVPVLSISLISFEAIGRFDHVAVKIGTSVVVSSVIAISILCYAIPHAISELRNFSGNKKEFLKGSLSLLLKLALPLLPYYFSVMAIGQIDKIFISNSLGNAELGKYSVAYSAGIAATAITGGLTSALSPWVMRKSRAGSYDSIRETLGKAVFILCALILCFLSVAPELITVLAPGEYLSYTEVMFVIALAPIPLLLTQLMSSIACASERTKGNAFCGFAAAITSLLLSFIIIPRFGAVFAAYINLLSYTVLATLQIVNVRAITGHASVDVNKTLRAFLLTLTVSLALFTFREFMGIRIFIGLISFLIFLYMLKGAKPLLKENRN